MDTQLHVFRAPHVTVNEDRSVLVAWEVEDLAPVTAGQVVCILETSKVALEIEADADGLLCRLAQVGAGVVPGDPLALIGPDRAALERERERLGTEAPAAATARKATDKAADLARRLGLDLAAIPGRGVIREADVLRAAKASPAQAADPARLPVAPVGDAEEGRVDPEFLRLIENDPGFAHLDSALKIHLYRLHGASIGENARIGKGSVLLCKVLRLGREAVIGEDCAVRCERFVLGIMSVLGRKARVGTREVCIGDVFFSGENLLIGGGGAFGPRSRLRVGDNCLVSSNCILNTGEGILIGNEVGLSPGVQCYTHSHWQSVLKGYSAAHAAIVIEDEAYVTGGVIVTPGARIGAGATVLANSVVSADVEPRSVVGGNPCALVARIDTDLRPERRERIARQVFEELRPYLEQQGFDPARVVFAPRLDAGRIPQADAVLCLEAADLPEEHARPVVFDLGAGRVHGREDRFSDEVRNFLRRRGIRFQPIHWRYVHDLGSSVQ